MSKYECSHVLGIRARQLQDGAPMLVSVADESLRTNAMYVAAKELRSRQLEVKIRRPMTNNRYYDVSSAELTLPDDLDAFIEMWEQPAGSAQAMATRQ